MLGDETMHKKSPCAELTSQTSGEEDRQWRDTCENFLASVPTRLHDRVQRALQSLHSGGTGLKSWVATIAWRGGKLPESVPEAIIEVYLCDQEAVPLYDCEECGIAIPVRASRTAAVEDEPEHLYFPNCPVCGGRTGLYSYLSRQYEIPMDSKSQPTVKPR